MDQLLAEDRLSGPTPGVLWHLGDHLGTSNDLVDGAGVLVNQREFDAFGNLVFQSNSEASSRYGFTGRELDAETGLYFYRARYYDPAVGRFISEDPLGLSAGDVNVYRYVRNSPTTLVDPTGTRDTVASLLRRRERFEGTQEQFNAIYGERIRRLSQIINDNARFSQQANFVSDRFRRSGRVLRGEVNSVRNTAETAVTIVTRPGEVLEGIGKTLERAQQEGLRLTARRIVDGVKDQLSTLEGQGGFVGDLLQSVVTGGGALNLTGRLLPSAPDALDSVPRGPLDALDELPVDATLSTADRLDALLNGAPGLNISPQRFFEEFDSIGRSGTFVTDTRALEDVIGPIGPGPRAISQADARAIESSLGLNPNSLSGTNVISVVENIADRRPASPISGNDFFLGPGAGLPGGAPELVIQSIPTSGGDGILRIILEVSDD